MRTLFVAALAVTFGCSSSDDKAHTPKEGATPPGETTSSGGATSSSGATSSGGEAGFDPTSSGGNDAGTGGSQQSTGGVSSSGGAAEIPEDLSAEIYDAEHLPRFDIELSAESIEALAVTSDEYVPGTLLYDDEVVSNIGVRIKGEGSL